MIKSFTKIYHPPSIERVQLDNDASLTLESFNPIGDPESMLLELETTDLPISNF